MKLNGKLIRKSPWFKGFFLLLPHILTVCALFSVSVVLFETVVAESVYYQLITGMASGNASAGGTVTQDEGHIPVISYGQQWATLNVEGWEERDVPVFFGDENALLRKGAGMRFNSRFCGQGGRTVLSAHVTFHFYELETTKIGTLVTMDTLYGKYVYEVVDTLIFHYQDTSVLSPVADEGETLFLYTCYPRENGYLFKTQRLALICRKVEGKEWQTYG